MIIGIISGCLYTVHHGDFYPLCSSRDITQVLLFLKSSHLPLKEKVASPLMIIMDYALQLANTASNNRQDADGLSSQSSLAFSSIH